MEEDNLVRDKIQNDVCFENKTVLNAETQYVLSSTFSVKFKIFACIFAAVIFILGIILYEPKSTGIILNAVSVGLMIGAIAVVIVFIFFWNKIMRRTIYKLAKKDSLLSDETYNCYMFNFDKFNVTTTRNNQILGVSYLNYDDIEKITENANYFFIYIRKSQAFVMDKLCFTNCSATDFHSFIKNKVETCFMK